MTTDEYYDDTTDDTQDADTTDQKRQNDEAAKLRKQLKESREALKELEELRTEKAERDAKIRLTDLGEVFAEMGLRQKFAKFYPADGATDAASVKAWAIEEEFLEPATEDVEEQKKLQPFRPLSVDGSSQVKGTYTKEEIVELAKTDPRAAQKAYEEGRVTGLVNASNFNWRDDS